MKRMEKRNVYILIILLLLIIFTKKCWWDFLFIHDYRLYELNIAFSRNIESDEDILGSFSELGLIFANGNHCDYIVGEFISSKEPYNIVSKHYKITVKSKIDGSELPVGVMLMSGKQRASIYINPELHDYLDERYSKLTKQALSNRNVYCIFLLDFEEDAGIDLRCM